MRKTTLLLACIFICTLFTKSFAGNGTENDPYTVAEAIANQDESVKWVKGYIVGCVKDGTTTFDSPSQALFDNFNSSTNVFIADNANETDYTKCLSVKLNDQSAPAGFRNVVNLKDNPTNKGKELLVQGKLRSMFTNLKGCRDIAAYEFGGQGTDPNAIFSETFAASQGGFTVENVTMNAPMTYIWQHNSQYKYMIASAFVEDATRISEGWLISPAIDLTGKTDINLTFEHAIGPDKSINVDKNTMTLWFSDNYTSGNPNDMTWTQVAIPNFSTTGWGWVTTSVDIPAAMENKANVRFAYKYATTTESASWEIRNVVMKSAGGTSNFENILTEQPNMYISNNMLVVENIEQGTIVEFYNALGAKVQTSVFDGNAIELNNLSKGVYIVRASKFSQKIIF